MRSDEFIDLYKQLEDELEVKFSTAKQRRYTSSVDFIQRNLDRLKISSHLLVTSGE